MKMTSNDVVPQPSLCAPGRYTAVLVDSCQLSREGLTAILRGSRFGVVLAAASLRALGELEGDADPAIDLLLCSLDPQRPIELQLAAIQAARRRDPNSKTVLLMPSCSVEDFVAAMRCGVEGIILNDISGEKLIYALELVMHNQQVLPLDIFKEVLSRLRSTHAAERRLELAEPPTATRSALPDVRKAPAVTASMVGAADAARPGEPVAPASTRNVGLSDRETQILQSLVAGCANKLIARKLDIAEATVKVHIKGLLRKLNVSNRTQAAIWALNQSLLPSVHAVAEDAAETGSTQACLAPTLDPICSTRSAPFRLASQRTLG